MGHAAEVREVQHAKFNHNPQHQHMTLLTTMSSSKLAVILVLQLQILSYESYFFSFKRSVPISRIQELQALKKGLNKPGYMLPDLSQKDFPAPPESGVYDLVCIGKMLNFALWNNSSFHCRIWSWGRSCSSACDAKLCNSCRCYWAKKCVWGTYGPHKQSRPRSCEADLQGCGPNWRWQATASERSLEKKFSRFEGTSGSTIDFTLPWTLWNLEWISLTGFASVWIERSLEEV